MPIQDPSLVVNITPADTLKFGLTSLGVVSIRGANPFGTVIGNYLQPAPGQTVQVTFDSTGWMAAGQAILIDEGGNYSVLSVDSTTLSTLVNLAYDGNAVPDATILAGAQAHPTGFQGLQGIQGNKGDKGDQGIQGPPALDMSTFQLDAGSQYRFSVQLIQGDGVLTNLNPDRVQTVQFIALPSINATDSSAYWSKTTPHPDVQILNADTGLIALWVQGIDTQNLSGQQVICLVRTTSPAGIRETPAEFSLLIT